MKRLSCWLLALASSIALQHRAPTTQPRPAAGLVWSNDPNTAAQDAATRLAWEAVPAGEEIPPHASPQRRNTALRRDGDWLPQISNMVPVGFGAKGWMFSL